MNCKKFNVGSKATDESPKKDVTSSEIIGTVSEIEIKPIHKSAVAVVKRTKNNAKKPLLAVCCTIFFLSAVISYVFPLPKGLETVLLHLSELITEPVTTNTVLIFESDVEEQTATIAFPVPAASDSTENIYTATEDIPAETIKIPPTDLSGNGLSDISNETAYNVNISELLRKDYPIEQIALPQTTDDAVNVFADKDASPAVLIIHTHGTEGYADSAIGNYRTYNKEKNVVAAGKYLAQKLEENNISVIHCEKMFDESSYIKAYSNSFSAVSEYLAEYPSIKYVIDLHRDAIPDSNGSGYARLSANIDGADRAQLMFVVGSDEAGAKHSAWRENLRAVFEIQKDICEVYPSLMRKVNLRRASFNQQLSRGYFILEAGNCENSLEEVFASIDLFAPIFAKTITK